MGLEGQSPAVTLNTAIVEAIARQNHEAARAAAAEMDRQLANGLAGLTARLDRMERSLAAGPDAGSNAGFGKGRAATAARLAGGDPAPGGAMPPPELPEPLPPLMVEEDRDHPRRAGGWRAIGPWPVVAIIACTLAIAALVAGLVMTMERRDAALAAQRDLANNQSAFCTMAGEAIRALPPVDAAADPAAPAPAPNPAGPPEQERLARAAAALCGTGD
jgi:hypothetical protein